MKRLLPILLVCAGCATDVSSYLGRGESLREVEPLDLSRSVTTRPTTIPVARQDRSPFPLRLAQARQAALANNLDVAVARLGPRIARADLDAEQAVFEATFNVDASYSNLDSPTVFQTIDGDIPGEGNAVVRIVGGQAESVNVNPSLSQPLRTGGVVRVGAPVSRLETDQGRVLNPQWEQDVRLSLNQPLLRGFGSDETELGIRVAATRLGQARARLKLQIVATLAATDRAYWRLWLARQAVDIRREQLRLAVEQFERAQRLQQAGTTGELEVVRAESAVADARDLLVTAEADADRAQRQLRVLFGVEVPGSPLMVGNSREIEPTTVVLPLPYELNAKRLAAEALGRRAELIEARLTVIAEQARLVANARQAFLPQLDLTYEYSINGLGGSYSDAADVLGDGNFQDHTFGLRFEQPLGNRRRRAVMRASLLQRAQALLDGRRRAQTVRREVYDAVDAIDAGYEQIVAAERRVAVAIRLLAAEERRVATGGSSSAELLEAQRGLSAARLSLANAKANYEIARVNLAAATGTLLGKAGVVID
jgi:outer membrane protein TolC